MAALKRVIELVETLYPLSYAEDWDHPGLVVGDLDRQVSTIAFAVDPTMEVIDQALACQADLLICHHPLLFRSVHAVSGLDVHGAMVSKLYRGGCGLWVGHTNADASHRGVGQAAADAFGLVDQRPLVPLPGLSQQGQPVGLGRLGRLPQALPLADFASRVAQALPANHMGVQVAGDLEAPVSTVVVLPGSGDSLFDEVRSCGADVYVTSDLRHHPATDAIEQARYEASLREGGDDAGSPARPALINTPHSAIEGLWLSYAMEDVPQAITAACGEGPEVIRLGLNTDPWDLSIPCIG
ncbi:Nif3-like dinuclear metal center hexameric protein [Bifidobacterium aemilianum]|uniref:GTP cyclohydrolase 1 type 2 homolog n=1 Tax=Bifidobacterium aemilianum TaxID=2493120 RepID=A0A366KAT1_9BIFI|nr:Nif3-like dinuclear metal center hexameric protein [Bifidobacterium aemilianum]RBP98352.1 Nif3-like dinuclear metal center hexameric protein [Bifidobacterium aemilianum]